MAARNCFSSFLPDDPFLLRKPCETLALVSDGAPSLSLPLLNLDQVLFQQQQQQMLSTPTMHPNLVNTLKSIISSPSSDSVSASALDPFCSDDSSSSSPSSSSSSSSSSRSPSLVIDLERVMNPTKFWKEEAGRPQAAIVPVHLIKNRRPFKCKQVGCGRTFKNPQTLKMHCKTHFRGAGSGHSQEALLFLEGFPLVSSSTCSSSSPKAGQNKKIPSKCPVCRRTFVGLYELRRHYGRKHSEGEKPHACAKCGKRFYVEVDLRDHEKMCGEPLYCNCGMRFAFKCNLVAHKRSHPNCQDNNNNNSNHHSIIINNSPSSPLIANCSSNGHGGFDGNFTIMQNSALAPKLHYKAEDFNYYWNPLMK